MRASHRGQHIAERMLVLVEALGARARRLQADAEVLSGNQPAQRLYARVGFAGYQLDPAMGDARFLQKWLT
ncbi:MAG: hypothetical protein U1F00_19000 [Rhodoferax sp.]